MCYYLLLPVNCSRDLACILASWGGKITLTSWIRHDKNWHWNSLNKSNFEHVLGDKKGDSEMLVVGYLPTTRIPSGALALFESVAHLKCLKCNTKHSIERQVMCRTKEGFSTSVTQWERDEWLLAPLRALTDRLKAASFDCDSVIVSQIQSCWVLTWGRGNWTFIKVWDCLQAAL